MYAGIADLPRCATASEGHMLKNLGALSNHRRSYSAVAASSSSSHDTHASGEEQVPEGEKKKPSKDPRINDLGRAIEDDFAMIRDNYGKMMLLREAINTADPTPSHA